jgi:hypothetical protein
VWDPARREAVFVREEPGARIESIEPAPDGRSILVLLLPEFFQDLVQLPAGRVLRLDARTGEVLTRYEGHEVGTWGARFGPGGHVVTWGDDGAVRFWDFASGRELARAVRFEDGAWVVARADGRFDANDLDEVRGLHWIAADAPFSPLPLEVFFRAYYEPALLPRTLAGEAMAPLPDLGTLNRLLPRVSIVGVEPADDGIHVTVEVASVRRGDGESGARDLRLFRDGRLVGWRTGPLPLDPETRSARVRLGPVLLPGDGRREVTLGAYAFNDDRVKSRTARRVHALPPDLPRRRGRAYVVGIGVDAFSDPAWDLAWAAADARRLTAALAERLRAGGGFEVVETLVLTSERGKEGRPAVDRARKRDVAGALRRLDRARPEDLVVIAVSTHGVRDAAGSFFLLPSDLRRISTEELTEWLRPVDAGETILIVDACQAAASVEREGFKPGPMGDRGLGQLAYDKRMRVLAATQASDAALESARLRHGFLTYSLVVDGLSGGLADHDPRDGGIRLDEWLRYGLRRVPVLVHGVLTGRRPDAGLRWLGLPGAEPDRRVRRVVQQPSLFDFARERSAVALPVR